MNPLKEDGLFCTNYYVLLLTSGLIQNHSVFELILGYSRVFEFTFSGQFLFCNQDDRFQKLLHLELNTLAWVMFDKMKRVAEECNVCDMGRKCGTEGQTVKLSQARDVSSGEVRSPSAEEKKDQ